VKRDGTSFMYRGLSSSQTVGVARRTAAVDDPVPTN
jgi:hypothetical protein